jgi:Sulfotransferase family
MICDKRTDRDKRHDRFDNIVALAEKSSASLPLDRPVFIAGSGRCGSTLLQSILNTNPDFLIWGEHNGFLRQIAAAYYQAKHPRFPDHLSLGAAARIERLREARRWPAWDNLCGEAEFRERFQTLVRSFFADPEGRASRWGFKEIRYPRDSRDRTFPFLFDCFPEARLVILVREPCATIFSMLSRWAFSEQRPREIGSEELDLQILAAAKSWHAQYAALHAVARQYVSMCMLVRYEDLRSAETYVRLASFLDTSSFDFKSQIAMVKDTADKTGPAAARIQQRMQKLQLQIESMTSEIRAIHGYTPSVAAESSVI